VTRRLARLLVLIAIAVAPFGRIGASQAMAQRAPTAMPAHSAGQPMPDGDKEHRLAVKTAKPAPNMRGIAATTTE
jgi:hypothetical protein